MSTTWTVIKQSDNRRDNTYAVRYGTSSGTCPSTKVVTLGPTAYLTRPDHYPRGTMTAFLGVKTKNYRPNVFRITPAVHRRSSIECSDTLVELKEKLCYNSNKEYIVGSIRGPIALLPNVPSNQFAYAYPSYDYDVDESLVQKAMGLSNEAQAAVLTSAVELPMTLSLFLNPLKSLGNALNGLSNPRTLRKISKNVKMQRTGRYGESIGYAADAWLQLRYGILPLMGEIDTYRKLYNSKLETPLGPILKSRAGGGEESWSARVPFSAVTSFAGYYFWGWSNFCEYVKRTVTVYTRRQWDIQGSLGLDLSGVLGAAWERIPYSFVLDWFVDMGSWLKAIVPVSGVTTLGNSVSTSHIREDVNRVEQMASSAKGMRVAVTSEARNKSFTYNRWIDHVPQLLPAASPFLGNITRMIDSVSLVFNRAKNKLPYR